MPLEIMNSVGLTMGDLFPEPLERDFKPLYMAQQHKKNNDHHRLVLESADGLRGRGERLTRAQLNEEKEAYLALR